MLSDSTEGKADEWFAVNSLDINTRTATGSRSSQALKGNIGTPGADKAALVVALTSGKPPTTPSEHFLMTQTTNEDSPKCDRRNITPVCTKASKSRNRFEEPCQGNATCAADVALPFRVEGF